MSMTQKTARRHLIGFNLEEVLTQEEIKAFSEEAEKAGAKSLTEHFLNITIRPNFEAKGQGGAQ